ncbi:MAG: hypothetical protein M3071_18320 [Actinomycetota bacterium]|nr:hypothetical protein [Actinomycetota bacterium]
MSVHFVADPYHDNYGGDDVVVTGPPGTPCDSDLIGANAVNGPNKDGSGPVTLYIGPRVEEEYPQMAGGNVYDPIAGGSESLSYDGALARTQVRSGRRARAFGRFIGAPSRDDLDRFFCLDDADLAATVHGCR